MSLRVRYIEAARKGDLIYLQTTSTRPTQQQLNRAFRIACEQGHHDIVTFLIGQGANDFSAGLIICCRLNNANLLRSLNLPSLLLTEHTVYEAFSTACFNHSLDAAVLMASTRRIEWYHSKLSHLSPMALETATRALKHYWCSGPISPVYLDEWLGAKFLQLLQPHEYYLDWPIKIRYSFPVMAQTVISHRLDKYYRFKGYLIFYLPIPDLVTLCCGYF